MLVLITYDVNTAKQQPVKQDCGRLLNNASTMEEGFRILYLNVFDNAQCIALKALLTDIIDSKVDSLRFYYLGNKIRDESGACRGRKRYCCRSGPASKNWCEQEVHMNSYGDSHLKNYEITFINLFFKTGAIFYW